MKKFNRLGRQNALALLLFLVISMASLTPLSLYAVWLFPVPIALLMVQHVRIWPIVAAIVVTACLFVAGFGWSSMLFGVAMYYVAVVLSDAVKSKTAPYSSILVSTIVFILAELVFLALLKYDGVDIFRALQEMMYNQLHQDANLFGSNVQLAQQVIASELSYLKLMLPALVSVVAFMLATIDYLIVRNIVLDRVSRPPVLTNWYVPQSVITVYFLSLIYVYVGNGNGAPYVWQVVNNALFLSGFVIGVQGLAMIWRRVQHRRGGRLWFALLLIVALVPFARFVYIVLGLVDNMRQRQQMRKP